MGSTISQRRSNWCKFLQIEVNSFQHFFCMSLKEQYKVQCSIKALEKKGKCWACQNTKACACGCSLPLSIQQPQVFRRRLVFPIYMFFLKMPAHFCFLCKCSLTHIHTHTGPRNNCYGFLALTWFCHSVLHFQNKIIDWDDFVSFFVKSHLSQTHLLLNTDDN